MSLTCVYILRDSEDLYARQTQVDMQIPRVRRQPIPPHTKTQTKKTTTTPFDTLNGIKVRFYHFDEMVSTHSSDGRSPDPYLRPSALQVARIDDSFNFSTTNTPVVTTNMGIQSQNRDGAIRKCLKRGTKAKHHCQTVVQQSIEARRGLRLELSRHIL